MPVVIPFIAEALVDIGAFSTVAAATTAVTNAIIAVVVSTALTGLASLFAPGAPKIQEQKQNVRSPVAPRSRYYGRVKTGGVYAFLQASNGILYQIIMLMTGRVDGFEAHYLGEDVLTVDGSGNVTVPKRYINTDGRYLANIQTKIGGSDQGTYSSLESAFPGAWTSAMPLNGVASALITLVSPEAKNFTIVFPAGLVPYNAVYRAAQVYDPRDHSADWHTLGSYSWTRNGVLCVLDYMTHPDGMRLPFSLFEGALDVWASQADIADDVVALANGGSEPLYSLGGGYQFTDTPKTVLPKMLDPMDARVGLRADGAITIDVGQWQEPEDTISDSQIYAYVGMSRGRAKSDVRNEIRAQFVSPDYLYVEQEAQPWRNEASIAIDGLQTASLDLTWAPSHRQARVRMKIESYRQDPNRWVGQIITKAAGLIYLVPRKDGTKKRTMRFQIEELSSLNSTFEVLRFAFDVRTGRCTFNVAELTSDAYAWNPATDEGTAPALPNAIAADQVEDPSDLTVTVSGTSLNATVNRPVDTNGNLTLVLQYAEDDDAKGDDQKDWNDFNLSGWGGTASGLGADSYDVRTAFRNPQGVISDYIYGRGFIISGTAPAAPSGIATVVTGGSVAISFKTPNSASFSCARVWRATDDSFDDATDISGQIFGSANQTLSWDDTPGSGTWHYWATAEDASTPAKVSAPDGSVSVTI